MGCQNLHSCRSLQRKPLRCFDLSLSCKFLVFLFIAVTFCFSFCWIAGLVASETAKPALVTGVISTLSTLLSVEFLRLKKLGIFYQQVISPPLTASQKHYPSLLDTSTHINKGDRGLGLRSPTVM